MKKAEAAAQKGNDYPVPTGDLSHTCFTQRPTPMEQRTPELAHRVLR